MQQLGAPIRIGACVLLLVAIAGATPARVDAACGEGPDPTWLARYAGRHADTIILARLVEQDADGYHFQLIDVYRGEAPSSPIVNAFDPDQGWHGIVDVGACSGQSVQFGELFVYATGDRSRNGPLQVIFPRVPDQGMIVDHWAAYTTLDHLLALLGILPATSTADVEMRPAAAGFDLRLAMAAFVGGLLLAYGALAKRQRST